jgi:putative sterol carrier protein
MAVDFLTDEWMTSVADACNSHDGFTGATANTNLSLQFNVTDVPERGQVDYHITIGEGSIEIGGGTLEGADVTVANNYETAAAISKGELNTQVAFMTGKLKVTGDMAKLMMNQAALTQFANAAADVEVSYP